MRPTQENDISKQNREWKALTFVPGQRMKWQKMSAIIAWEQVYSSTNEGLITLRSYEDGKIAPTDWTGFDWDLRPNKSTKNYDYLNFQETNFMRMSHSICSKHKFIIVSASGFAVQLESNFSSKYQGNQSSFRNWNADNQQHKNQKAAAQLIFTSVWGKSI